MTDRYVDSDGREWLVRELVKYDTDAAEPFTVPPVVRSALAFERDGERRVADEVPLYWREFADGLALQFARATRLPPG